LSGREDGLRVCAASVCSQWTYNNASDRAAWIGSEYQSGTDIFADAAAIAFRGIDHGPALSVKNNRLIWTLLNANCTAAGIPGDAAIRYFRDADADGFFVERAQRFRRTNPGAFAAEIAVSKTEIQHRRARRRKTFADAYNGSWTDAAAAITADAAGKEGFFIRCTGRTKKFAA
jgi:hypothetical protein